MFKLFPYYTRHPFSTPNPLPLPIIFYPKFICASSLYMLLPSTMWRFTVNLSPLALESRRNKTASSNFVQGFETLKNRFPPKHPFTNTVADHNYNC